jgi:hypothetical protein
MRIPRELAESHTSFSALIDAFDEVHPAER